MEKSKTKQITEPSQIVVGKIYLSTLLVNKGSDTSEIKRGEFVVVTEINTNSHPDRKSSFIFKSLRTGRVSSGFLNHKGQKFKDDSLLEGWFSCHLSGVPEGSSNKVLEVLFGSN